MQKFALLYIQKGAEPVGQDLWGGTRGQDPWAGSVEQNPWGGTREYARNEEIKTDRPVEYAWNKELGN